MPGCWRRGAPRARTTAASGWTAAAPSACWTTISTKRPTARSTAFCARCAPAAPSPAQAAGSDSSFSISARSSSGLVVGA
ncbi:zinc finger domain-containing protein [Cupriavidus necator]